MKLLGVFEDRYWAKTQTKEIRYTACRSKVKVDTQEKTKIL